MASNPYDQFDANPYDKFDDGKGQAAPLKIGAEGFSDALRSTMKSKSWLERNAAAVGNFPTQMYEGSKQRLGFEDPVAIRAGKVMDEEAPVGSTAGAIGTLSLASLAPGANSFLGQVGLGGATGLLTPTEGDESSVKNALLGSAIAGPGYLAMKGLGNVASKWLQGAENKVAATASQQSVRDATIKEAQSAGYVLPPTVTGGGTTSKALESLGGKAAIGQEASVRNQQITNKIARAEAGLSENEPISESTLKAARERLAQPYRDIADLSEKAAADLEKLKSTRADAKAQWQFYNRSADPKALKAAEKLDAKAEALEKSIEGEAVKATMGQSALAKGLLDRLKESRKALAKNYDVEKALNVGSGDVDAAAIGRMLDKRGEQGVTGGLGTIGRFAEAFPKFARERPSGDSGPGVSKLTPYAAAALGLGGYGASEHYGMGPWGMSAAALPLLSGPARSIALSKMMQTAPEYAPGASVRLADLATNNPRLRGMVPASAAVLAEESR